MISSIIVRVLISGEIVALVTARLGASRLIISRQLLGPQAFIVRSQDRGVGRLRLLLILLLVFNFHACLASAFSRGAANRGGVTLMLTALFWLSVKFFSANKLFSLYIFFELSLVPIFIIVFGWGYQLERVRASTAIVIYTIIGSLPLLVLIIFWSSTRSLTIISAFISPSSFSIRLTRVATAAFIVKLPVIGFHMWLPKAHVEAPVVGSIFLAAILLKLGGYGLIVFQDLLLIGWVNKILIALRTRGAIYVALLCCQALDLKVLIAFSSVGHMGLGIITILLGGDMGTWRCVSILVSHGFSSSARFYVAYIVYKTSGRRRILVNKNLFGLNGAAMFFWVIIILALIGCPPSINIWVEIVAFLYCLSNSSCVIKIFMLIAFLRGVYGLVLMGKFNSGRDLVFKSEINITQADLTQLFFAGLLSVISLVLLPVLFY